MGLLDLIADIVMNELVDDYLVKIVIEIGVTF